ncbi:hypothetical protein IQ265_04420 [Nodosilinea sp. LEGE 06152]|uniref:hypothetical protein n=1 Tax=Nodosilinea sp. LEGE 06152 TaxID=2777966 RepID=UPI001881FEED|nr:hypothetical protein [Nodosilinea sp. LEGE 06152]MBE9156080.1 hypothetical protein [Nodosilinea sp. LEGE 06152]
MNEYKLLSMINTLVAGKYGVPEFEKDYYDFYLDEVPNSALNDEESEFFGSVQEKLDWVDENPDSVSRSYG